MKVLSKIISYIFHPLLFPTYGTLLVITTNPNMFGYFGQRLHGAWLIIVFALTFVFPSVWLLMMKRLDMIENLELSSAKERIIPFIATATFYLWTTWMFKPNVNMKIPTNELLFMMMLGASASIFIGFFVNIFSKISLHAMGAGSLFGLMLPLVRISTYDLRILLVITILLCGIIGAARLILHAHEKKEIFTGYLVGFSGQFITFAVLPLIYHF